MTIKVNDYINVIVLEIHAVVPLPTCIKKKILNDNGIDVVEWVEYLFDQTYNKSTWNVMKH